jgi:hypothetical protein
MTSTMKLKSKTGKTWNVTSKPSKLKRLPNPKRLAFEKMYETTKKDNAKS